MDFDQLKSALQSLKGVSSYFRGCVVLSDFEKFCKDTFNFSSCRNIYVILIGNKGESIGHFILFYWISNASSCRCIIADSLGFQVSSIGQKRLQRILEFTKTTSVQSSSVAVQDRSSCMCGAWVIAFTIWLTNGYSLAEIERLLKHRNPKTNDQLLYSYLRDKIGLSNRPQLMRCKLLDN